MFCAALIAASVVIGQAAEPSDTPVYQHLKDLECFVGDWEAKVSIPEGTSTSDQFGDLAGKDVVLSMSVHWAPGKCAQIVNVNYHIKDVVLIMGTGIRAWDQDAEKIIEHQFTTHKGIWSGNLQQDGDAWVYKYEGKNLDRKKGVGTRTIVFKNKDHFLLKETDQTLGGKPQPDIEWQFARKQ